MKILKKIHNLVEIICDFKNWYKVILNSIGILGLYILKYKKGIQFYVRDRSDSKIIQAMFNGNCYNSKFVNNLLLKNKHNLIIDVGGHIGVFSFWIDSLYKGSRIYIIEPDNYNYWIIKKNIKLNNKTNFIAIHNCISSENGIKTFYSTSINHRSQSSSIIKRGENDNMYNITSLTLSRFIDKYKIEFIDLLKLDCEGAEYEIIENVPESLYKKIGGLLFEYHEDLVNQSHIKLVKILTKHYRSVSVEKDSSNKKRGVIYATH